MLKKSLSGLLLIIGGTFAAFVVLFFFSAWGEWHCGINDLNVGIGSAIAGVLLTIGSLLWRSTQPIAKRWKLQNSFFPLGIFFAFIVFLFIGSPTCPFMSR
jgi:hypothetical protein